MWRRQVNFLPPAEVILDRTSHILALRIKSGWRTLHRTISLWNVVVQVRLYWHQRFFSLRDR
jgi:hypothetical protein